jgi:hypothetical protein
MIIELRIAKINKNSNNEERYYASEYYMRQTKHREDISFVIAYLDGYLS